MALIAFAMPIRVQSEIKVTDLPQIIVGAVGLIVGFINTIVLIVLIFFTEKARNKTFDKYGKRRAE